jgi:threonine aldolase
MPENNIARLATDHHHAKLLSKALEQKDFVKSIMPVETNIVI